MMGANSREASREQRQTEAQHAVGPHLQQHAGQHHGARCGRLDVRIRQPGVKREQRNLDREGYEKGPGKAIAPREADSNGSAVKCLNNSKQGRKFPCGCKDRECPPASGRSPPSCTE